MGDCPSTSEGPGTKCLSRLKRKIPYLEVYVTSNRNLPYPRMGGTMTKAEARAIKLGKLCDILIIPTLKAILLAVAISWVLVVADLVLR